MTGNVPRAARPGQAPEDAWPYVTFAEARIIRRLTDALDGETISRIVSGPSISCLQTVSLLASERQLDVELSVELDGIASVPRALYHLGGVAERPSLVCMPTPLLRAVIELLQLSGARVVQHAQLALLKRIDEMELHECLSRQVAGDRLPAHSTVKPPAGRLGARPGVWERKI